MVIERDDRKGVTTRSQAGASTSSQGAVEEEMTQQAGTATGQADVAAMFASLQLMLAQDKAETHRFIEQQAQKQTELARELAELKTKLIIEGLTAALFNKQIQPNATERVADVDCVVGSDNDVVGEMEDIAGKVVDVVGEKDVIVAEVDDVIGEADDVVSEEDNVVAVTVTDQLKEEIFDSESSNDVSVSTISASEEKPEVPQCDSCLPWAEEEQRDHVQFKELGQRGDRKRPHLAIETAILVRRDYQTRTDSGMLKEKVGHLRTRCLKPKQPQKDLRDDFRRRLMARESQTRSTVTLARGDQLSTDSKYDPFEHRNVTHPTSTAGAFFHLLKSSLGSGLLAMPAAFKHIGIIPGCFGTALVALIATHCVHILVCTSRALCEESRVASLSYAETCEKAFKHGPKKIRRFSPHIRHFADYAMAGVCLGGTSVYVVFIASSLKDICDHIYPTHVYSVKAYCGFILLPFIITTQIRHLKYLVPFSVLANLCLLLTFVITCYYTFEGIPNVGPEKLAVGVTEWPMFLSTAIFAMEGINVVMPIENEMANPKYFLGCPGVLNVTMVFVAGLYGVVGLFGYMKYGEEAQGSVTLNLPQDEILAMTAKILVAVAVFFTYCLQMYAPLDILWTRMQSRIPTNYQNLGQVLLRTLCVVLTVTLAVAVPDLELLIGLVGAIFFSTLGLLIPVVVETAHKWDRDLGPYLCVLWKNVLLLLFYCIVLVSGCYASISAIVARFS